MRRVVVMISHRLYGGNAVTRHKYLNHLVIFFVPCVLYPTKWIYLQQHEPTTEMNNTNSIWSINYSMHIWIRYWESQSEFSKNHSGINWPCSFHLTLCLPSSRIPITLYFLEFAADNPKCRRTPEQFSFAPAFWNQYNSKKISRSIYRSRLFNCIWTTK